MGEMLMGNINDGYLEGLLRGYRSGILTSTDYANLCQCETIDDMKMHLSSTDYGNFLQNEPSPISTTTLAEKCTVRRRTAHLTLPAQFNEPKPHPNPHPNPHPHPHSGQARGGVQLPQGAGRRADGHVHGVYHVRLHDLTLTLTLTHPDPNPNPNPNPTPNPP